MSVLIYGPESYRKYFKSCYAKESICRDLNVIKVEKGIVFPYGRPFEIGVYDNNHKFVYESDVMEKISKHNSNMPKSEKIDYIDEDVLFIGDMHWHFGHFLLEHLNRIYPLLNKKYRNMKCVIMHKSIMNNKNDSYIYDLLNVFGIKKQQLIVVKQPTKFRNVFVPEASDNAKYTSKYFSKTFDAFVKNINKTTKYSKIYVSRNKMGARSTFGEIFIQNIFKKNGFHIIYPEKLSLRQQIKIISGCNVLAGCAGTALHLALFMKKGGTVIQLKRNTINADNCAAQNNINKIRGLNGIFIWASIEKQKTQHYTGWPQIIGLTKYLRQFFTENNFVYDKNFIDEKSYDNYIIALNEYRKIHGNYVLIFIKKNFIKITSCFIPGRVNRANYRRWLKGKFNIN